MGCLRSQDRGSPQRGSRAALALMLATQLACMPKIMERCRLITHPTPPPALPAGFAELDALLLRRATDMTLASRHLDSSLVIIFRKDFAELLLPALCERLEQARQLAMAGRAVEAGRKYQALLVSSQVLAFAVAVQSMAQYADRRLQSGGQISFTQEKFAGEATPILEAALAEDPRELERALNAHPEVFPYTWWRPTSMARRGATVTHQNAAPIEALMAWYRSRCDGDWEHQRGVRIGTLDNPGWSLDVDLAQTPQAGMTVPSKMVERSEDDWVFVEVKNDVFRARGGPGNLAELINLFMAFVGGRPISDVLP